MTSCAHTEFIAKVAVARLEDTGGFMAEIEIRCKDCGMRMQFLGLEAGLDLQGATVDLDGCTARIAICPAGSRPSPLQVMGHGIKKFQA